MKASLVLLVLLVASALGSTNVPNRDVPSNPPISIVGCKATLASGQVINRCRQMPDGDEGVKYFGFLLLAFTVSMVYVKQQVKRRFVYGGK